MPEASIFASMRPVSADSHITEPPDCYVKRIDPKYRDRAPTLKEDPVKGATFIVDGISPVSLGLAAAAGISSAELRNGAPRSFDRLHRGGWDPKARIADMDRDGVYAELIYPSVGMALYGAPDLDYMSACFRAYNIWLNEFVDGAPGRLFGIGQSAAASPAALIEDMKSIKALGFKGVMVPLVPGYEDYDDPAWDPAWEKAVELGLPLCLHVLARISGKGANIRGSRLGSFLNIMRATQDTLGVFVFSGIFDRHPNLKLVCVEADAGWVPHYALRMDHAYERFGSMHGSTKLKKLPSEYLRENVWFTFQDDIVALQSIGDVLTSKSLLWATDYPHSDSTWPYSMELLEKHTKNIDRADIKAIVHDNVVSLFDLPLPAV